MEELKWDPATGKNLTTKLTDYKILRSTDIPNKMEVEFVETIDPTGPFGAKRVGEPPMVPTAAAVANAIYNAIRSRIKELPITPEKSLKL